VVPSAGDVELADLGWWALSGVIEDPRREPRPSGASALDEARPAKRCQMPRGELRST
jgi:hypothetical protein